jgi:hypothetical protein
VQTFGSLYTISRRFAAADVRDIAARRQRRPHSAADPHADHQRLPARTAVLGNRHLERVRDVSGAIGPFVLSTVIREGPVAVPRYRGRTRCPGAAEERLPLGEGEDDRLVQILRAADRDDTG